MRCMRRCMAVMSGGRRRKPPADPPFLLCACVPACIGMCSRGTVCGTRVGLCAARQKKAQVLSPMAEGGPVAEATDVAGYHYSHDKVGSGAPRPAQNGPACGRQFAVPPG